MAWRESVVQRRVETLLIDAFEEHRPRLLLDGRGMQPIHNGTSHAILGLIKGFSELPSSAWQIDVLVSGNAARFHELPRELAGLRILRDNVKGHYVAAALLSQPWTIDTIAEMHRQALFVVFNFFDTIAWDVIYPAPHDGLGDVWTTAGLWADGLLFDSTFTRDRFLFRFPLGHSVRHAVTHLSLSASEYAEEGADAVAGEKTALVVMGNAYDHKDVARTVSVLAEAFPVTRITAIGGAETSSPLVTVLPSGHVDDSQLMQLCDEAAAIVYPSFYEGFGLPVVRGMARGSTVVVRRSALWDEIAANTRMPGSLVQFRTDWELVQAVGAALHGRPTRATPQGGAIRADDQPVNWRDCAQRALALIDDLLANADLTNWRARELALNR